MTLTTPVTASRTARAKNSKPSALSGRSHALSRALLGSTPTHSGPNSLMRSCSWTPNESAMSGSYQFTKGSHAVTRHPLSQFALYPPGRPGVGEGGGAHFDGVGAGHQQGHDILS